MRPREKPRVPYRWRYEFIVPLRLYLDDLRDIFAIVRHIGSLKAETDTHVDITSIEELDQLRGMAIQSFRVAAANEHGEIEADFGGSGASITITSPRPEFVGALHSIQTIAWRHWRKFSLADHTGIVGVLWAPVLLIGVVALYSSDVVAPPWNLAAAIGLALTAIAVFLIGQNQRRTRWTEFRMVAYAERPPGFLQRNADQLAVGAFFLVLGFILGQLRPFAP